MEENQHQQQQQQDQQQRPQSIPQPQQDDDAFSAVRLHFTALYQTIQKDTVERCIQEKQRINLTFAFSVFYFRSYTRFLLPKDKEYFDKNFKNMPLTHEELTHFGKAVNHTILYYSPYGVGVEKKDYVIVLYKLLTFLEWFFRTRLCPKPEALEVFLVWNLKLTEIVVMDYFREGAGFPKYLVTYLKIQKNIRPENLNSGSEFNLDWRFIVNEIDRQVYTSGDKKRDSSILDDNDKENINNNNDDDRIKRPRFTPIISFDVTKTVELYANDVYSVMMEKSSPSENVVKFWIDWLRDAYVQSGDAKESVGFKSYILDQNIVCSFNEDRKHPDLISGEEFQSVKYIIFPYYHKQSILFKAREDKYGTSQLPLLLINTKEETEKISEEFTYYLSNRRKALRKFKCTRVVLSEEQVGGWKTKGYSEEHSAYLVLQLLEMFLRSDVEALDAVLIDKKWAEWSEKCLPNCQEVKKKILDFLSNVLPEVSRFTPDNFTSQLAIPVSKLVKKKFSVDMTLREPKGIIRLEDQVPTVLNTRSDKMREREEEDPNPTVQEDPTVKEDPTPTVHSPRPDESGKEERVQVVITPEVRWVKKPNPVIIID